MAAEASEVTIPVPWGHVSGRRWGPTETDKPLVIALHGWQDNAGTFDKLAPLLPGVPLLCLDMPGQGFSSPLRRGQFYFHWWDNLIVLRRIIQYLKIDRVSLMGHSRGGSVVFLYAASFPDEVEKVICIDSAFPKLTASDKLVEETKYNIDKFLDFDGQLTKETRSFEKEPMMDVVEAAYGGSVNRDGCELLMKRGMLPNPKKPGTFYFTRDPKVKLSGLGVLSEELVLAYAKNVKCEYLNIRFDDGNSSAYSELYDEVLRIIKENAKRFDYFRCPGTHHQHLNDPSEIAPVVIQFLET